MVVVFIVRMGYKGGREFRVVGFRIESFMMFVVFLGLSSGNLYLYGGCGI